MDFMAILHKTKNATLYKTQINKKRLEITIIHTPISMDQKNNMPQKNE